MPDYSMWISQNEQAKTKPKKPLVVLCHTGDVGSVASIVYQKRDLSRIRHVLMPLARPPNLRLIAD